MKEWRKVKLGSLLAESKVASEKPDTDKRLRVRLNMLGVEKRPKSNDKEGATKYYIRKAGQFIYGKQNLHKGAFGIIPEELDGYESSSDIPTFDVDESCYPEWIYYFFKKGHFYAKLEVLAKGVGSKRIQPRQIFELDIYLPDKEEQRKVLNEIKKAEIKNDKLLGELNFQEENLTQLRKSILNDAVQGKLTAQWRTLNPNVEPANELLKRISVSKKVYAQGNKIKNGQYRNSISGEIPFEIPPSWVWSEFRYIYNDIEAGKSPKCLPYPAEDDQWGVIKISAISWGIFQEQENKKLPINVIPFVEKEIKAGDFILTRANTTELVARSVIVIENVRSKLLLNDKTLRVTISEFINKEYINISNNSPYARLYYSKVASGTSDSMKNVSRRDIDLMSFPIPPFEEQNEIVKKVKKLQLYCDKIANEIRINKKYLEKLMQSFLCDLLGLENTFSYKDEFLENLKKQSSRKVKYDSKTTFMELIDLLKVHGKLHAEDLWKMSKYFDDKNISESIDKFYSDLKKKVEIDRTIKEVVNEKGYLELV
ncbi:hypothetical protein LJC57_01825 [Parabacteroides sp. OttesenSCG-928-G07]|nr:hypothetical protein [Parabacteroides sp. OttesenSCG-928-G21]MDL2277307.1 hypothetical protein [Parabacteroides sp. OttesenSCG-928-G07]